MEGRMWKGRKVRSNRERDDESKTEGSIEVDGEIGEGREVVNGGERGGK